MIRGARRMECIVAEAMTITAEANHALDHLSDWATPTSVWRWMG